MQYTDERHHLRVEFETKGCDIPPDELTRMEQSLDPLGEAVQDFASTDLRVEAARHPRSGTYHVEARLKLAGRSLVTNAWDEYLDCAFRRCAGKMLKRVQTYKENPDRRAEEVAEDRARLDRDVTMPEDPGAGPLGAAVAAGDYMKFRNLLAGYEDWVRLRVGRWVQRYPQAERRIDNGLSIGDLVEEVYLNAFERYPRRRTEESLSDFLDGLLDPALQELLRHPDEEHQNASFARTLRETPT